MSSTSEGSDDGDDSEEEQDWTAEQIKALVTEIGNQHSNFHREALTQSARKRIHSEEGPGDDGYDEHR